MHLTCCVWYIQLCSLVLKSNFFFWAFLIMNRIVSFMLFWPSSPAKCRLSPLPVAVCLYVSACSGSGGRSLERGPQTYLAPVAPTATEHSTFLQGVTIANTRMRWDLPLCHYRGGSSMMLPVSADVQLCPHGARLHVEESDWHQGDHAIAPDQSLLLGAQRQVKLQTWIIDPFVKMYI